MNYVNVAIVIDLNRQTFIEMKMIHLPETYLMVFVVVVAVDDFAQIPQKFQC